MLRRPLPGLGLFVTIASIVLFGPCSAADAASAKRVSRVLIRKSDHTMQLFAEEQVLASYKIAIGPGGLGPKKREGDMVTPVGRYHVTMHQPSQYKIFLRLDYPNAEDYSRFATLKQTGQLSKNAKIGGDIGIHGPPVSVADELKSTLKAHDWTAGCIAVDDDEISEIAHLVRDGTTVDIED